MNKQKTKPLAIQNENGTVDSFYTKKSFNHEVKRRLRLGDKEVITKQEGKIIKITDK